MTDILVSQPGFALYFCGEAVKFEPESAEIIGFDACGIPHSQHENIDAWLHEFLEMFLWEKPYMKNYITDKESNEVEIAHIIATICHGGLVRDEPSGEPIPISGDEAWERYYKKEDDAQ